MACVEVKVDVPPRRVSGETAMAFTLIAGTDVIPIVKGVL